MNQIRLVNPELRARLLTHSSRRLPFQPPGRAPLAYAQLTFLMAGLLACSALRAPAQSAADLLSGPFRPKQVRLALYEEADQAPVALVRVDQAYTDYQRKGFFRIGALPLGVLEGVSFEVPLPERLARGLEQLNQWLGLETARRLELRRVSLLVGSPASRRLEAARARLRDNGQWELLDGVTFACGTNRLQAPRAALQVTGPHAGQLVLETSPGWTTNLLTPAPGPEPFTPK